MAETIKNSLDNREFGCGIFLDLQKTFDTVNHSILLMNLENYGIQGPALEWFESYLSGRELKPLKCYMCSSTGFCPWSLLLLIFINDLPNSTSVLSFYFFADDTNIYFEAENLDKLQRIVNNELKKVKDK